MDSESTVCQDAEPQSSATWQKDAKENPLTRQDKPAFKLSSNVLKELPSDYFIG